MQAAEQLVAGKLAELLAQRLVVRGDLGAVALGGSAMCSSPSRRYGDCGANSSRSNWISGVA
jgi:hypothetical protein